MPWIGETKVPTTPSRASHIRRTDSGYAECDHVVDAVSPPDDRSTSQTRKVERWPGLRHFGQFFHFYNYFRFCTSTSVRHQRTKTKRRLCNVQYCARLKQCRRWVAVIQSTPAASVNNDPATSYRYRIRGSYIWRHKSAERVLYDSGDWSAGKANGGQRKLQLMKMQYMTMTDKPGFLADFYAATRHNY